MPKIKCLLLLIVLSGLLQQQAQGEEAWSPEPGERIVFIGNEFADHLRLYGYFETILHACFPEHQLSLRNMGWGGDTVSQQLRPSTFGDIHSHLEKQEADIIFICLGMMESYRGEEEAELFGEQIARMVDSMHAHHYNQESPPEVVLISPIAHEDLGGRLPSGDEHNRSLKLYTEAMEKVAEEKGLPFVNLFDATLSWYEQEDEPGLTFDGIHLHDLGYRVVSQLMADQLGLIVPAEEVRTLSPPSERAEALRQAIIEKNYQFYMRWRAVNGEYIYGSRRNQWSMGKELAEQDIIIQQAEERIWALPPVPLDEI